MSRITSAPFNVSNDKKHIIKLIAEKELIV